MIDDQATTQRIFSKGEPSNRIQNVNLKVDQDAAIHGPDMVIDVELRRSLQSLIQLMKMGRVFQKICKLTTLIGRMTVQMNMRLLMLIVLLLLLMVIGLGS